jgi:glycosyltransferase involved in cell wall biosynthesis
MFVIGIPCHTPYLKYLGRCLKSIKHQTRAPDLIVISLSSFSGDVSHIVETASPIPIKVLQTQQHYTPGQNRNAIINATADATILSFIDADDMLHPQHVEVVSKFFDENPEQQTLLMSFKRNYNKETFTVEDYEKLEWTVIPSELQIFHNCYKPTYPPNWTPIMSWAPEFEQMGRNYEHANGPISFRRSLIEDCRYSTTLTMGEDQHFNAQLWERGLKFSYTPQLYFIYFTHK